MEKKYIKPKTRRTSMEPNMLLAASGASLGNGTTPQGNNINNANAATYTWAD